MLTHMIQPLSFGVPAQLQMRAILCKCSEIGEDKVQREEVRSCIISHLSCTFILHLPPLIWLLLTDRLAGEARELDCPICRRPTAVPDQGFPVCVLTERIKDELKLAMENAGRCNSVEAATKSLIVTLNQCGPKIVQDIVPVDPDISLLIFPVYCQRKSSHKAVAFSHIGQDTYVILGTRYT